MSYSLKNVRSLEPQTFNTPATEQEIRDVLAEMKRVQHVNVGIIEEFLAGKNPYILTLGKLFGLADPRLGWDTTRLAKQLGVEVRHPRKDGVLYG